MLLGIYLKISSLTINNISANDTKFGGGGDIYYDNVKYFFGDINSFTVVAISTCLIFLLFQKNVKLLIGWAVLSIIFINPVTSNFVGDYLTSRTAYGRLFLIFPAFAIIGTSISILYSLKFKSTLKNIFALLLIPVPFYCVYVLMSFLSPYKTLFLDSKIFLTLQEELLIRVKLDVSKPTLIGQPDFKLPQIRLSKDLQDGIGAIRKYLPPGKTLSTLEYAIATPMITTKYQQYYLWPIPAIIIYADTPFQIEEADIRIAVANYLDKGDLTHEKAFTSILSTDIQNLVISDSAISPKVREIALLSGFKVVHEMRGLVLYTR